MPSNSLDLSSFKKKSITFEFRYEPAYLLWDRAGAVWSNLKQNWANLQVIDAKPNLTSFRVGEEFALEIGIDKAHITFFGLKHLDVAEPFEQFLYIVRKTLELKTYSRLGYRVIYEKKFKTKEDSTQLFKDMGVVNFPQGQLFNIAGEVYNPELSYKWEDEKIGLRVLLKSVVQNVKFDAPPGIEELQTIDIENNLLIVDFDYYTKAETTPGQIKLSEWIKQIVHFINRDSKYFLGKEE
jgi:hypothetical protein